MALFHLTVYLLLACLYSLTESTSNQPRMTITENETSIKRIPLPGHHAPVGMVLEREPDTVIAAGQTHLHEFHFQNNPQKTPEVKSVLWSECIDKGPLQRKKANCNYNITLVQKKSEDNQVFLCGTNGKDTVCCDMDLAKQSPVCIPSEKTDNIKKNIKEFVIKEGEPFALVESEDSDLFITYSGSQDLVGIFKFGKNRIIPPRYDKEQHYVGLVPIRREDDPMQSKVYAFFKEKNTGVYSEMWLPFVTRVCMEDRGGIKNSLQFSWTSQLKARLFCGDPDSRKHFSELVDVATVHADQWQNTTVYALFRNEWGMSAVCVYTIQDIENIFTTSNFKDSDTQSERPRQCVADSTKLSSEALRLIIMNTELHEWVRPVYNSSPLLFNHHSYTHIYVDSSQNNHPAVLFLSLNNGGIHKVMQSKNLTFVIAEYRPFNHRAHILHMVLNPSTRKLYVNSGSELVQLDVANCAQYGNSCQDCVLARDPYCGWNGTHCTPDGKLQDVTRGDHSICVSTSRLQQLVPAVSRYSTDKTADKAKGSITLPPDSKYFLQCPMSSHHAQYTWCHPESNTSCSSMEQQCLFLIDSMGPEQVGTYTCVSEEMGYSRVLAQYQLRLGNRAAGWSSSPLVWLCLMAVLIKSVAC
ncbi:semaphorin-7A isoform X1 [Etheostoma cragini]|uniref:semaphorin-7A isoform X1 n=1 Tax=Etheostoma cragini TaxID=417921 RepID=UPI00155F1A27|nr:semaphorin-7A isoform X1 [Etheostoma cragini]